MKQFRIFKHLIKNNFSKQCYCLFDAQWNHKLALLVTEHLSYSTWGYCLAKGHLNNMQEANGVSRLLVNKSGYSSRNHNNINYLILFLCV